VHLNPPVPQLAAPANAFSWCAVALRKQVRWQRVGTLRGVPGAATVLAVLVWAVLGPPPPAVEHLAEAKRILSQFGQSPILARVEVALAELEQ